MGLAGRVCAALLASQSYRPAGVGRLQELQMDFGLLLVQILGYGISLFLLLSGLIAARDAIRASKSWTGLDSEGMTIDENIKAMVLMVALSAAAAMLTRLFEQLVQR